MTHLQTPSTANETINLRISHRIFGILITAFIVAAVVSGVVDHYVNLPPGNHIGWKAFTEARPGDLLQVTNERGTTEFWQLGTTAKGGGTSVQIIVMKHFNDYDTAISTARTIKSEDWRLLDGYVTSLTPNSLYWCQKMAQFGYSYVTPGCIASHSEQFKDGIGAAM